MRPASFSARIAAMLAAGAMLVLQSPAALAQDCLTEHEVTSLVTFALPTVMNSAITTCQPQLSSNGYFATQGRSLVARYAVGKAAAWPTAKAALFKLGGSKGDAQTRDLLAKMPDEALQPFAEGLVGQMVGSGIKPDQCVAIERGARLLAPLPPENTAELITFILSVADKPKPGKTPKLSICPAQN